jgi:hypothetical protein
VGRCGVGRTVSDLFTGSDHEELDTYDAALSRHDDNYADPSHFAWGYIYGAALKSGRTMEEAEAEADRQVPRAAAARKRLDERLKRAGVELDALTKHEAT